MFNKLLIEKMNDAGLSAQSIVNYTKVVKMVVASAVNDEGEQIYPRKWNHDFVGLPVLKKEEQHRPTVTETEVEEILTSTKGRYTVLFALLAGTGLRIGEALALRTTDLSSDRRVLFVRHSIWHGQEQQPKTPECDSRRRYCGAVGSAVARIRQQIRVSIRNKEWASVRSTKRSSGTARNR